MCEEEGAARTPRSSMWRASIDRQCWLCRLNGCQTVKYHRLLYKAFTSLVIE
ncbi:hypothetical protein J6590_014435 [Homalodisca vitripennis]|nr:hypothetical protein J6590_014435 [Homalodisca vitripennis]